MPIKLNYNSGNGDAEYSITTGDRVSLSPATDLWMRGARYATIKAITLRDGATPLVTLKSDHPAVKGRFKLPADYISPIYNGFLHGPYRGYSC